MRGFVSALTAVTVAAGRQAVGLLAPEPCVGCGAADGPCCAQCRAALSPALRTTALDGLAVHSGLEFAGAVAALLRACKRDARPRLLRLCAPALAVALEAAGREAAGPVWAVPVPASARALRRRGFRAVEVVLRAAGVHPARMLRPVRATADQRGLDVTGRAQNVAGGFIATLPLQGVRVVVVDDVVTTGATLREAARALRAAGAVVLGAATVAVTLRRSDAGLRHPDGTVPLVAARSLFETRSL